jgi:hypothetical protein
MTSISTTRGTAASPQGSATALYNNSGSVNATRVITNGLTLSSYGFASTCQIANGYLMVCPSGGIGYTVGRAQSTYQLCYYVCSVQFISDIRSHAPCNAGPQTIYYNGCCSCFYQVGSPGISGGCCVPIGASFGGNRSGFEYYLGIGSPNCCCPVALGTFSVQPQFWMGPSDSIRMYVNSGLTCCSCFIGQGKGGYGTNCSCSSVLTAYSFTLVSE